MRVPILKLSFSEDDIAELTGRVASTVSSGHLTMGSHTKAFEEAYAEFNGSRFAVAVSSGTAALEIILRALGVEGQSVIVPTNTFMATALAVMHAGNRVIFADSDPYTFSLMPGDVEARLEADTKAVVVVHIGGLITPAIDDLRELCQRRRLYLIEDCAHAHGSSYRGRKAGGLGVAGAFSFFPTKVLVTGEGGMLTTDDEGLYREALKIRNHGKDPELGNRISTFGSNYRMSELTAAVGRQQMQRVDEIISGRQRVAARYDRGLAGSSLRVVRPDQDVTSTYYKYLVYLPDRCDRARVKQTMRDTYGVALTGEVYAELCHREPIWERHDAWGRRRNPGHRARPSFCGETFPGADRLSGRHICLPLFPSLSDVDADYVVESVLRAILQDVGSEV